MSNKAQVHWINVFDFEVPHEEKTTCWCNPEITEQEDVIDVYHIKQYDGKGIQ